MNRMLKSMKFWTGVAATVAVVLAQMGFSQEQANVVSGAITIIAGAIIVGVAVEDKR